MNNPYKNEHAARLRDPRQFKEWARANDRGGKGVAFIFGIKNGSSFIQAIRFDKKLFTVAEAKAWLERNHFKPIKFEPARGTMKNNPMNIDETFNYYLEEMNKIDPKSVKGLERSMSEMLEMRVTPSVVWNYAQRSIKSAKKFKRNPVIIRTEDQYRKTLMKMLEDEQEGIKAYKRFILSLPVNPEANKVRRILSEILADEERHEKLLLRLAVF